MNRLATASRAHWHTPSNCAAAERRTPSDRLPCPQEIPRNPLKFFHGPRHVARLASSLDTIRDNSRMESLPNLTPFLTPTPMEAGGNYGRFSTQGSRIMNKVIRRGHRRTTY